MKKENNIDFIQSLLETSSFEELSQSDRKKVLSEMTESDYKAYRNTILAAGSVFAEANNHEPKPMIVPKKQSILMAPIPLYQMLVGIAAIFLLMLLIFPINKIGPQKQSVEYITLRDTIRTEVLKVDTVQKVIEKPVFREKLVYVNQQNSNILEPEMPRLLNVPMQNGENNFVQSTIQNKGFSMKDDSLLLSLPKIF